MADLFKLTGMRRLPVTLLSCSIELTELSRCLRDCCLCFRLSEEKLLWRKRDEGVFEISIALALRLALPYIALPTTRS